MANNEQFITKVFPRKHFAEWFVLMYHTDMQSTQSLLHLDRIVILFRWLALLVFSLLLELGNTPDTTTIILVTVIGFWTLLLSAFALTGRRLPQHSLVTVVVDTILGSMLLFLSSSSKTLYIWGGLLPLISSSLYYGIPGGFILGIFMSMVWEARYLNAFPPHP